MDNYLQRAQKILSRINELAAISEDENCIARTFGTKQFMEGADKVLSWMQEAGLKTRIDNIGNVRGRVEIGNPTSQLPKLQRKTFVIASHIDTVINAGKFDGPLGVIMGIDLIEQLKASYTQLPFDIELIAFSDEEGVRFHTTYLGSKVVAGSFDVSLLDKKDPDGIALSDVMKTMNKDHLQLRTDVIDDWLGYFEIHIEQGPVLYETNIPVAIVTGIAGQRRTEITFKGIVGHAGTVPMNMRNDALCCAAAFILETEKVAIENKLVATVGKLNVTNSASNVIPGEVVCSLDIRSADETLLASTYERLQRSCKDMCEKRNIAFTWSLVQSSEPIACDVQYNNLLEKSIAHAGYEVVHLVSGAGHDAVPVSEVSPVCMLLVRCFQGISHNPLEDVELNDIAAAIKVSDNFIKHLIEYNQ